MFSNRYLLILNTLNLYLYQNHKIIFMKKYYFTIALIIFLFFGLISCSNEENKTQNLVVSRPTVPITSGKVQIGSQVWMTKNLNVSRYRNGDLIPEVQDSNAWAALTTGAWCYYENDRLNGVQFGKLYNWYAVIDPRGLAPIGYHVPTDDEWTALTTYLGGEDVAGNKMKETSGWYPFPEITNINSSGFKGLPGGYCGYNGIFTNLGYYNSWWSSSENVDTYVWYRFLVYNSSWAARTSTLTSAGFSVRCLQD